MIYELLDQIAQATAERVSPNVKRIVVAPGEVAWDDCCEGQVWARLVSLIPSGRPFPQTDVDQKGPGCGVILWSGVVGIGVLRCAAVLREDGSAPTPKQIKADAEQQVKDLRAIEKMMVCDLPSMSGFQSMKVVGWTPQGPEGGCVGGEWQIALAIGVGNCD